MNKHGFTLIEVLVSVAILAFIMVSLWTSTSQSLDAKERFETRDAVYHEGRVALRKLMDDLDMAYLLKDPRERGKTAAPASTLSPAAPEIETRPRPITFFVAEDNGERDGVSFTSLSNLRLFKNAKESEQCKVQYKVRPSEEDSRIFNVVRTYAPYIDEKDTVEGVSYVVASNVREFNLEYYDLRKQEWVRSWNTTQLDFKDQLPRAVRVTIAFPDPDDDEASIVLSTATMVPLSKGPIEF